MLGAKARAAEYNAAKAASARQADREAEEQSLPPRPVPISLGAFTKTSIPSRNKGVKTYKPLILSDSTEDDKSISSFGSNIETKEDSPGDIMDIVRHRPASLPVPSPSFFSLNRQDLVAYPPGVVPYAPRAMLTEDDLSLFNHAGPYQFGQSSFMPGPHLPTSSFLSLPMTPVHHVGLYTPGSNHYNANNLSLIPIAANSSGLSYSEPKRVLAENAESNLGFQFDDKRSLPLESNSKSKSQQHKILHREERHVYGPDDLSPCKAEIKERQRREWLEHHPDHSPTPHGRAFNDIAVEQAAHRPWSKAFRETNTTSRRDSFQGYNSDQGGTKSRAQEHSTEEAFRTDGAGSLRILPSNVHTNNTSLVSETNPNSTHSTIAAGYHVSVKSVEYDASKLDTYLDQLLRPEERILLNNLLQHDQYKHLSVLAVSSPMSFKDRDANPTGNADLTQERDLKPLFNIFSDDWCEWKPITQSDRDKMTQMRRNIEASEMDSAQDTRLMKREFIDPEMTDLITREHRLQVLRREKVQQVVNDFIHHQNSMKDKERKSGTHSDTHAAIVQAIGNIYVTLSQYEDETKAQICPQQRTYASPPEFAIERSVQLNWEIGKSLFDEDNGEARAAPARIARDPRFRPQPMDDHSSRRGNERMSRLLSGGRAHIRRF